MRGQGSIYLRGKTYWIRYSWNGMEHRESAKTSDQATAERLLLKRLKSAEKPRSARERRYSLADMLDRIRLRYAKKENRSFKNVEYCWPHIEAGFAFHRATDIDNDAIEKYQAARREAGAKPATINREVAYVKLGIKLLGLPVPTIANLVEDNARQGFLRVGEFNNLLDEIRDPDARDLVEFLYNSGWRSSEPKAMQWHWLDLDNWTVRLPAEFSKNKKPRTLPLEGVLRDVIKRRIKLRDPVSPFVFHRNGKPIKSFRRGFQSAAKRIELTDLVPHDMRRSAIRNFRKAGLSETDGMKLSGHRTRNVYDRYNIVDDEDSRQAMRQAQEYLKHEAARKVIPLKRKA